MVVCVLVVAGLARDFGPMLSVERSSLPASLPKDTGEEEEEGEHSHQMRDSAGSEEDSDFEGELWSVSLSLGYLCVTKALSLI